MAECPNFVIWNGFPPGAHFCASASGTSDDFGVGIRMVGEDGSETTFFKNDLVPGPARRSLTKQGYGVRITMIPGPSGPTVTVKAWIEGADEKHLFECIWTAEAPSKVRRITLGLVPA